MERRRTRRLAIMDDMKKDPPTNSEGKPLEVCPCCRGRGKVWQYHRKQKMSKDGKRELKPAGYVQLNSPSGVYGATKRGEKVEVGRCGNCDGAGIAIKGKKVDG